MSKFPGEENPEDQIELGKDIEIDGEPLSGPFREEIRQVERDSAIERVHHRVTLLAILIPCLLGALVLYAYLDIKDHVSQVRDVGSTEVKELSQDVLEKMSSTSAQYSELLTSLSNRITTLEAAAVITKEGLRKQQAETRRIDGTMVDKESLTRLEEQTAEAIKTLETLQEGLGAQRMAVESLNDTLGEEMSKLAKAVETTKRDRNKQASVLKRLSETKMDQETFDQFLKNEREIQASATAPLKKEIASLREGVSRLQKQVRMLGRSLQLLESERSLSGVESPKGEAGDAADAGSRILEQEIAE